MAVLERHRLSQAPLPNVNLYCSHCNSQIGIFDNEWIRLTAKYAKPREKGTHFGIDTGTKVKIIPNGQTHNAAAGCGMSEVFAGQYFYKMSRTYLRDSQSTQSVDPIYSYTGDLFLPPPKAKANAGLRTSMDGAPIQSQTPLPIARQPRDSFGHYNINGTASSFNSMSDSFQSPELGRQHMAEAMPNLDGQVSEHQRRSDEVSTLRTLVAQQGTLLIELQREVRELSMQRQETPRFQSATPAIMPAVHDANETPERNELSTLREENRKLRARFASIASAMSLDDTDVAAETNSERGERTNLASALGKRKRVEEEQLPTPHSTQGSNNDQEHYFGRPHFPTVAPMPHQTHEEGCNVRGGSYRPLVAPHGYNILNQYGTWSAPGYWNSVSSTQPALPPPPSGNKTTELVTNVVRDPTSSGVVEFSDDEMSGLPFPSVGPALPRLTIQEFQELHGIRPSSSEDDQDFDRAGSDEPVGPIDLDVGQHWTARDVEKMIEEEKAPKAPKEPADPNNRIQSTERYLNAELEELGLQEWIGKDKRSPEYRAAIQAARSAHKEAKKAEALARKGLRSTQPVQTTQPTTAPAKAMPSKTSKESLGETEAEAARTTLTDTAVLEPELVSPQDISYESQNKESIGPTNVHRNSDGSVDEISSKVTVESTMSRRRRQPCTAPALETSTATNKESSAPTVRASAKKTAPRAARKRDSAVPTGDQKPATHAKTPGTKRHKMTKTPVPLAEVTNQQKSKFAPPKARGRPPAAKAIDLSKDQEETTKPGEENEATDRMMTRRQRREAEIQKRDLMAQEAMEMEEV